MQQVILIADLIACSTCFWHRYAHHQELKNVIQVVAACGIQCFGFQAAAATRKPDTQPSASHHTDNLKTIALNTTGSNHLYILELLMMGIAVPETCSASNKICNKIHLLHIVGILFPKIFIFAINEHDYQKGIKTQHRSCQNVRSPQGYKMCEALNRDILLSCPHLISTSIVVLQRQTLGRHKTLMCQATSRARLPALFCLLVAVQKLHLHPRLQRLQERLIINRLKSLSPLNLH